MCEIQAHKISLECSNTSNNTDVNELGQVTANGTLIRKQPQPCIDSALRKQGEDAYRKLITSAYLLAVDGQPLSAFKTIVLSQKANGVKLIEGCDNVKKAKEFISHLANAVRAKISNILIGATAFSILCDGTQARKTGVEKELILVRVVDGGEPKYFMVALQNMDEYGSANSDNLKKAIDDVFQQIIDVKQYREKVVCLTADGASVNTGHRNGLFAQMTADNRPWLLGIHCVLHRVELAIKDSLEKQKLFRTVKDIMLLMYTLVKQSGKFQRHLQDTADELNVDVYKFRRVHGSRFVNHQRKGLEALLHNWIPLLTAIQTALVDKAFKLIQPKLTGVMKQLANVRILSAACFFKLVLDIVANLSLKFEQNKLMPFDVKPAIESVVSELHELLDTGESPIEAVNNMILVDNVLEAQLLKRSHNRKKNVANREYVTVAFSLMTNIGETGKTVAKLKPEVIPCLIACIQDRFTSFQLDIFRSMHWVDPANWRENEADEIQSIQVSHSNFY